MSDVITALVERGAEINATDSCSLTPLHYALRYEEKSESVGTLICLRADINARTKTGETALQRSTLYPNLLETLLTCCNEDLDINARDNFGSSALHWAVYYFESRCITKLIEAGINTRIRDKEGRTAAEYAVSLQRTSLFDALGVVYCRKTAPLPCDISQSHHGSSDYIWDDSDTKLCDNASPLSSDIFQTGNKIKKTHDMTALCKEHTNSPSFSEFSGGETAVQCKVMTDNISSLENIEQEMNCRDCEHMGSVCQEMKTMPDSIETDSGDIREQDSENSMDVTPTFSDSTLDDQCDGRDNTCCECPVLREVEISENESGDKSMMCCLRHLKQHQQSLTQFVGTVLNSKGSMGLNQVVTDNDSILKEVNKLMNFITQEVESRNALFECEIRLSGSWDEDIKVDYPDEFDYRLTLTQFSVAFQPIEVIDEGCQRYVRFILKDEYITQSTFSQFVDDNNYLDSRKLVSTLYKLINTILFELHSTMKTNLYPVKFLNPDKSSIDKLSFRWIGCNHKNLLIDIDVVPTLTPESWNPKCIDQSKSLLRKLGIKLSPFSAVTKTQDSRFAKN